MNYISIGCSIGAINPTFNVEQSSIYTESVEDLKALFHSYEKSNSKFSKKQRKSKTRDSQNKAKNAIF